ncbi:MAG: hypothetical protein ACLP72_02380, partial [Candidatus Sulfotelmatobacter sp.]
FSGQNPNASVSAEPAGLGPARPGQRPGPTHSSGEARSSPTRDYTHPTELDRYQMIRTYFQMLIEEELPDASGKMKQFASWFTHGVPGGAGLRKAIYESKSAVEILRRVEEFFEARLCGAGTLAREVCP